MGILLRVVATIALVFVGVPALHRLYGYLHDNKYSFENLPTSVRYASLLEFMFGYLVILLSVGVYLLHAKENPGYWPFFAIGVVAGIFWVRMAMLLRRGNPLARRASLLLSVLRIGTVWGSLFSIPSIWLLVGKQSRRYFSTGGAVSALNNQE